MVGGPSSWASSMSPRIPSRTAADDDRTGRCAGALQMAGAWRRHHRYRRGVHPAGRRAASSFSRNSIALLPVIEAMRQACDLPMSIDTSKPEVMRAAVAAGAAMINDVRALRAPGALAGGGGTGCAGLPDAYAGRAAHHAAGAALRDVVGEVCEFLRERARAARFRPVSRRTGWSSTRALASARPWRTTWRCWRGCHNWSRLGYPVLVGVSRKSMLGALLDRAVTERLAGKPGAGDASPRSGARRFCGCMILRPPWMPCEYWPR